MMNIDKCWEALEGMKWDLLDGRKMPTGHKSTQWIHLQDALAKGSVSKMECYEAIQLGYCPAHLTVRESRYEHLL